MIILAVSLTGSLDFANLKATKRFVAFKLASLGMTFDIFMKKLPLFQAVATLVGTIIGAGIFGIPYVMVRSGWWTGVLMLVGLGILIWLMELMFGEVALRTSEQHQLVGYAEVYLGKAVKWFLSVILILEIYGALLAYFIGEGQALSAIFGGPSLLYGLVFYFIFSWLIWRGIKMVKKTELFLMLLMLITVLILVLVSTSKINPTNFSGVIDWTNLFYPYGVLVFAYSGLTAVPQMKKILTKNERQLKKAIIIGCLLPIVVYLVFAWAVVGVCGNGTTELASIGLGQVLGVKVTIIANLLACVTMATGFLALGLALRDIYQLDYKIKQKPAWLLTVIPALAIYFLGAHDFIKVINLIGAVGVGLTGVVYVLIYWSARIKGKRKPEYSIPGWLGVIIGIVLMGMFLIGVVYTISNKQ